MKKKWIILIAITVSFFVILYGVAIVWLIVRPSVGLVPGRGIALIRIEGVISASGMGDGLLPVAGTSPESVIDQLREADRDDEVKSILIRLNSPGGTAAAGEEIYTEVRRTKKPVVVSVGDIGASAAYLIACGADKIVVSSASGVGSIGVIYIRPSWEELNKKIGLDYVVVTQGKYKDMYYPYRPLTEEERQIIQEQARILYEEFIEEVAKGRKLPKEKVRELATGQVFTGSQALKLGLVDELGNYQDAVDLAAKLGKIKGEPEIIEYGVPSLFDMISDIFSGKSVSLYRLLLQEHLQPTLQPILK